MRKLDNYVLREMIAPFAFGVAAFVTMLVSVDLLYDALKLIIRQGYPPGIVARAFLYRLPQTIALTLPMATMFSTLMAIGRLSGDGEVVALRAGGISLLRVAAPVLCAGLVVSPHGHHVRRGLLLSSGQTGRGRTPDGEGTARSLREIWARSGPQ